MSSRIDPFKHGQRARAWRGGRGAFDGPPSVVALLLVANGLVFLAQNVIGAGLLEQFALWPLAGAAPFEPWQLVSYAFLHGSVLHLFFNMFALWMFGSELERWWGPGKFAFYYFVCVVGAALIQLLVSTLAARHGEIYPAIGASGGVFGLLLAYGLMFPERMLLLLFPPIPIKAKWLVIGYGAIELFAGVTGTATGVAHFAHLGGMLFGYLLVARWRRTGSLWRRQ